MFVCYIRIYVHTYTLNGRVLLRSARSVLAAYRQLACKRLSPSPPGDRTHIYTPLRVSARDPRCARATSFLLGTMLHRLAPAAFDACMWGVAPAALGASGAWQLRRVAPAALGAPVALGDCGAWRLWCLAPFSVWVAIETFRGLQRPPDSVFRMSPE